MFINDFSLAIELRPYLFFIIDFFHVDIVFVPLNILLNFISLFFFNKHFLREGQHWERRLHLFFLFFVCRLFERLFVIDLEDGKSCVGTHSEKLSVVEIQTHASQLQMMSRHFKDFLKETWHFLVFFGQNITKASSKSLDSTWFAFIIGRCKQELP